LRDFNTEEDKDSHS